MDGLSFHPYPNNATDALATGYPWPNAGFVNLDRVKQALWDAFAGTAQPTTLDGLQLYLDEIGWQVDTRGVEGHAGIENVPVTTESHQAAVYAEVVRRAACDPDIAQVNVFGFRDDAARAGFQAGLHRADGTPRPSAEAVRDALARAARLHRVRVEACASRPRRREAPAALVGGQLQVKLAAAEGATARACLLPGSHTLLQRRAVCSPRAAPVTGTCATGVVRANRIDDPPHSRGRTARRRSPSGSPPRRMRRARRPPCGRFAEAVRLRVSNREETLDLQATA